MPKFKKINTEKYRQLFGIHSDFNPKSEKNTIRAAALQKAWEVRNFEIDKFWSRATFYWGFIVLIGTGYITVVTNKTNETLEALPLDFILICLGVVFSFAWVLIIKGSKQWQENWEQHIFMLEDTIYGPLYKTTYKSKSLFFSVSEISEIVAWCIFIAWCLLALQFLCIHFSCGIQLKTIGVLVLLALTLAAVLVLLIKGESRGINKVKQTGFIKRKGYGDHEESAQG